jgi:hypothetical protein
VIIVSCCNVDGGLFMVDENTLEVEQFESMEAKGLAVEGNFLYVAGHHDLRLYWHQGKGQWHQIAEHRAHRNWHGIATDDGLVYSVNHHSDAALAFDKLLQPVESVTIPLGDRGGRAYANDICFFGGYLYYCLNGMGAVYKWRPQEKQRLFSGLNEPHSLQITESPNGRQIYTCSSAEGKVLRYTYPTVRHVEQLDTVLSVAEYTRGLCLDGQYLWMGLSKYRRQVPPKKLRCGVIRKDLETGEAKFIALPSSEVYDIVKM